MVKYEVVEKSTGYRMSAGFPDGTLHKSEVAADAWMVKVGLTGKTHTVKPVEVNN